MQLSSICVLSFCTYVFDSKDYQSYDIDLKFDHLDYENNLISYNLTYLHDAVEFDIRVRIDGAIRDSIVVATETALAKISTQVLVAKKHGMDVGSCTTKSKKQALDSANQAVKRLTPCLSVVESRYRELFTNTKQAKANAKHLGGKLLSAERQCPNNEGGDREICLKRILDALTEEQADLQYALKDLYVLYNITQKSMPDVLKCIKNMEKNISEELSNILKQSYICVSNLLLLDFKQS